MSFVAKLVGFVFVGGLAVCYCVFGCFVLV